MKQARTFSTEGFCPPSVETCVTPSTLRAINPVDIPDALQQVSGDFGGPIVKDSPNTAPCSRRPSRSRSR